MIRDRGPIYVTGFGTTSRNIPIDQREEKGTSSESGYLSKRLNDHPFARFALYNTLAIAGMAVAGSLIKSGGIKLTQRWGRELIKDGTYIARADGELPIRTQAVRGVRKLQKMFDEWQGIERYLPDLEGAEGAVSLQRDDIFNANIFDFANEQFGASSKNIDFFDRLRASTARGGPNVEGDLRWRDFYKQSMIRQARRLPYELPALYATQRGVLDPLFGSEKEKPNWYNPIDVLSDFGLESAKNTAFLLLPLEVGPAAVREKYRRFMASSMYQGGNAALIAKRNRAILLNEQLSLLGQDFSNVVSNLTNFSSRTLSSFGTAIGESVKSNRGIVQHLHDVRASARRQGRSVTFKDLFTTDAADVQVGPFGGTGTFFKSFKQEFGPWSEKFSRPARASGTTDFEMAAEAIGSLAPGRRNQGRFVQERLSVLREQLGEAEFARQRDVLEVRARNEWRESYQNLIVPWLRNERLAKIAMPAEALEQIDETGLNQLVREMAERSGFSRRFSRSAPIEDVRQSLTRIGHQIEDPEYVRSFMRSKGAMSASWTKEGGFNALGLRRLSVQRAFEKDFFAGVGPQQSGVLRQLAEDIIPEQVRLAGGSVIDNAGGNVLNRLAVGKGVFETRSGRIVDFTPITRSFTRAMDVFEQNFKIPLVQINPATLFRWGEISAARKSPMIQMLTAADRPGFINPRLKAGLGGFKEGELGVDETLLLLKQTKSKGSLFRIKSQTYDPITKTFTQSNGTQFQQVPGMFRSMQINDYMEHALKSQGFDSADDSQRSRFKQIFSVSEDQPQSIFRFFSRWKDRIFRSSSLEELGQPLDINNPRAYVNSILTGRINGYSQEQRNTAIENLLESIGGQGLPVNLTRALQRAAQGEPGDVAIDEILRKVFSNAPRTGVNAADISNIKTPADLKEFLIQFAGQNKPNNLVAGAPNQKVLRDLQAPIRNALNDIDARGISSLEQPINSKALNRIGIHRRQDQIKSLLYKYFIAEEVFLKEATSGTSSLQLLEQMTQSGQKLFSEGKITGKELAEFRTAVLSIHADIVKSQATAQARAAGMSSSAIKNAGLSAVEESFSNLRTDSPVYQALRGYARFDDKVGLRYSSDPLSAGAEREGIFNFKRLFHRTISTAAYQKPGTPSSAFGPKGFTFVPTTGTVLAQRPFGALKSILGINTDVSPVDWSAGSLPSTILVKRLNRYFSTFGMGLKETDFRGPLDLYARGMVGKRVLPIVAAGSTVLAADATLGGALNERDAQGNRVYSPYLLGGVATGAAYGQAALAGITPGGQSFSEKKEELFSGEVPVRRGRWWALGNTPWRGDRIQYYRPSWYRRFMAGSQYTGQSWNSPIEKLLYGYDFSPLRPFDPYRYERKHYADRPYPVTGEYFSGPFGPLTGFLNATVGQVIKPRKFMHQAEMQKAMSQYGAAGYYGAQSVQSQMQADLPRVLYRTSKRQNIQIAPTIGSVLGSQKIVPGMTSLGSFKNSTNIRDPYKNNSSNQAVFMLDSAKSKRYLNRVDGQTSIGYLSTNDSSKYSTLRKVDANKAYSNLALSGGPFPIRSRSADISRNALMNVNSAYADAASRPVLGKRESYQYPLLISPNSMRERIIPRATPVSQSGFKYQASMLGYQAQELAGIYGFGFGSIREAIGLGTQDMSKRRPILMSAARAYGTERSFWDLGLGGLGDLPTPLEGEYANLEISEIIRRFIPHRRRDENEINPIPNTMAKKSPWLPGSDYFINFKEGDPYVKIPEGEMRLPGTAYERLHPLHSDATGRYGLLDKLKILGDIAPWSRQYKAVEKSIQLSDLNDQQKKYVSRIKDQVRQKKKTIEFSPYQYSKQNFETREARILGFVPGRADQFYTDQFKQPIRLSGVRASRADKAQPAQEYVKRFVSPGSKVSLTFDANKGPLYGPTKTIDAYVNADGRSLNEQLANSGYAKKSSTYTPLDRYMQEGGVKKTFGKIKETIFHRNTFFNTKFLPYRTPVEDWERKNVYGATFPQWQHPIRDYLKPIVYKSANRDVVTATLATAAVGTAFGKLPGGRKVGGVIGGLVGLTTSLFTNAKSYETGQRFIPKTRKKELALEEYVDILKYVKFSRLYGQARQAAIAREGVDPESLMQELPKGSKRFTPVGAITQQAIQYKKEMKRTMYGADLKGDLMDTYYAMPKRKRPYFMEFLKAPLSDRARILSTAPRLERRIYESRWGLKVEKRPDLTEYFQDRELPGPEWEGWRPDVDLETVKLKIANNMGLDVSQMGYYPQQVKEANLLNPSYPDFNAKQNPDEVQAKLRSLLYANNISGSIRAIPSHYPGSRVEMNAVV